MAESLKYFEEIKGSKKRRCIVKSTDDSSRVCGKEITYNGTSGFIRHLSNFHGISVNDNKRKSSDQSKVNIQQRISFPKRNQKSREEIFSRCAAVDRMSLHSMLNSNCVKAELSIHGHSMPKSFDTIKLDILLYYKDAVEEYKAYFNQLKNSKKRFSISTDEWSNMSTKKRYLNVSVHTVDDQFNLGIKVRLIFYLYLNTNSF